MRRIGRGGREEEEGVGGDGGGGSGRGGWGEGEGWAGEEFYWQATGSGRCAT